MLGRGTSIAIWFKCTALPLQKASFSRGSWKDNWLNLYFPLWDIYSKSCVFDEVLRIPDSYDAKIAEICNLWTFSVDEGMCMVCSTVFLIWWPVDCCNDGGLVCWHLGSSPIIWAIRRLSNKNTVPPPSKIPSCSVACNSANKQSFTGQNVQKLAIFAIFGF